MVDIAELGARYLKDPSVANDLLRALVDVVDRVANPGEMIEQEWLNCHWDEAGTISFLVDISDIYDRHPEPLNEFMRVCWECDEPQWHHFINLETLETDTALSQQYYRRFLLEGPTNEVIDSMLFLRASLDSDRYADAVITDMVVRGMAENPCIGILKLWRRYAVNYGVEPAALETLAQMLLGDTRLAPYAIRVVECLRFRDVLPMLDQVANLASYPNGIGGCRARRIVKGISDGLFTKEVAAAVRKQPWHPYVDDLNDSCMWRMLGYLRDSGAMTTLARLFNLYPSTAVGRGVFTHIMECDPTSAERVHLFAWPADTFPTSMHAAVYYMHMRGQPPQAIQFFYEAVRRYPMAVECIASRAPLVRREVTWARRKLLLCCMARATREVEKNNKMMRGAGVRVPLLRMLADNQCVWHSVMKFM